MCGISGIFNLDRRPVDGTLVKNDEPRKKFWQSHLKGINDNSSQIWNLVMFELWNRQFYR